MRVQTVLIASLFLLACSPSATLSAPPQAPASTPVVVAEPVADAPFAAHGKALTGKAPRVVLVGTALRVDGAPAGDVADLSEPSRGRALAAALSNAVSPASRTDASVGVFELLVPSSTKVSVVRSILETAAGAGFPHARLLVSGLSPSGLYGLDVDANGEPASASHGRVLHIATTDTDFLVGWKDGKAMIAAAEVPRNQPAASVRLPELAAKVTELWASNGQHREAFDGEFDRAVVHLGDGEDAATLIAIVDALAATTRPRGMERVPAFRVALGPLSKLSAPTETRSTNAPVEAVIQAALVTFKRCYQDGLQRDPDLRGSVRISFIIEQSGHVSNAVASQADLPDPAVVTCLVGAVLALEFPPQPGKVSMTIPVSFRSPD